MIVLAKSGLLKHHTPFRNGTEGQYRRDISWYGRFSSSSFYCPLYLSVEKASGQFLSILGWWLMVFPDGYRLKTSSTKDCWQGDLRKDNVERTPERKQIWVPREFLPECPQLQQSLLIIMWTGLHLYLSSPVRCLLNGLMSDSSGSDRYACSNCISQWLQKLMDFPSLRPMWLSTTG